MAKLKQISLFDFDVVEPEKVADDVVISNNVESLPKIEESKPDYILVKPVIIETVVDLTEQYVEEEITPILQKATPPKPAARGRKSIKAMELEADLINVPPDEILFSKQYFSMSEVTQMFNVNHSLIRFWENEFEVLQPRKNKKGDRLFRPEDVKNLELIYYLLRQKKYTIEGAKDYLKNQKKRSQQFDVIQKLEKLKSFLIEIKANL